MSDFHLLTRKEVAPLPAFAPRSYPTRSSVYFTNLFSAGRTSSSPEFLETFHVYVVYRQEMLSYYFHIKSNTLGAISKSLFVIGL